MRNHLIDKITEIAGTDHRIMMLNGDLGFSVLESFQEKFPDRYVNVGIAEQNMAAVAAGLALEGNMVFTYSIGNFPTLRCIEQIRNDVCYHHANVKIVAVGGGFAYGTLGMTHHATESIAMMRALPGMQVYAPCDYVSAIHIAEAVCASDGPCYVHLERGKEAPVFAEGQCIDVTKIQCMDQGKKIAVLCLGTVVQEAMKANTLLPEKVSVYSVLRVKPIDEETLRQLEEEYQYIITMEEQNIIGGLGGAVAEVLAETGIGCRLIRMGLKDEFTSIVGNQEYLRSIYGLDSGALVKKIQELS